MNRFIKLLLLVIMIGISLPIPFPYAASATAPEIGVNYNHFGTSFHETSILEEYHLEGVRTTAQAHMASMVAEGAQVVRFMVRFRPEQRDSLDLFVPSATGAVPEPYRTNLINILSDFEAAGFSRLIVAFVATLHADPLQGYGTDLNSPYEASTFPTSWAFIQDVRALALQYGPSLVELDLCNECGPWNSMPPPYEYQGATVNIKAQTTTYITQLLSNYVATYGSLADAGVTFTGHDTTSLTNLLAIYASVGAYPPKICATFYPQPFPNGTNMLAGLNAMDAVLTQAGRPEPLCLQETYHNNRYVAVGLEKFILTKPRPITEVISWGILGDSLTWVQPPYSISEYKKVAAFAGAQGMPTISGVSVVNGHVTVSGTNLTNLVRARVSDGANPWGVEYPLVDGGFDLPGAIPPSRCNLTAVCNQTLRIVTLDGRVTTPFTFQLPIATPTIQYAWLWHGATPSYVVMTQTGINGTERAYLVDFDGTLWADLPLITGVGGSAGTFNFQMPSNVPPSSCNLRQTCTIYVYVTGRGLTSNRYPIVLPAQPPAP